MILFGILQFLVSECDSIYKSIRLTDEKELYVKIELENSKFVISKGDEKIVNIKMRYEGDEFSGNIEYKKEKKIGKIIIKGEKKDGNRYSFEEIWKLMRDSPSCSLTLSSDIPLCMNIELSKCYSDINLSHLKVKELIFSGSGKAILSFGFPNLTKCENMHISFGLGKFEGKSLGNARFNTFNFEGGVGSYTLDFRGKLKGKRRIEIVTGIGNLSLSLPTSVGIRLNIIGMCLKFVHGLTKVEGNWYQSKDWGNTSDELIVHINKGLGVVRIEVL